jgi:hypothetical protein
MGHVYRLSIPMDIWTHVACFRSTMYFRTGSRYIETSLDTQSVGTFNATQHTIDVFVSFRIIIIDIV